MATAHSIDRGRVGSGGDDPAVPPRGRPAGTTGTNGARACSAIRCSRDPSAPTQARRQPRLAASVATASVSGVVPEQDTARTASAAPTQPGSRPACDITTWTGLLSPVMALSISPARPDPPPRPRRACPAGPRPGRTRLRPSRPGRRSRRATRPPGLLDQQDRYVVAHRVGQAAGGAGAHELAGVLVDPQRRVTFRAGQDVEQPAVDLHGILPIRNGLRFP